MYTLIISKTQVAGVGGAGQAPCLRHGHEVAACLHPGAYICARVCVCRCVCVCVCECVCLYIYIYIYIGIYIGIYKRERERERERCIPYTRIHIHISMYSNAYTYTTYHARTEMRFRMGVRGEKYLYKGEVLAYKSADSYDDF